MYQLTLLNVHRLLITAVLLAGVTLFASSLTVCICHTPAAAFIVCCRPIA